MYRLKIRRPKPNVILFTGLIFIFSSVGITASSALLPGDTIGYGIKIGNVPVAGLTVNAATQKVNENLYLAPEQDFIKLKHGNSQWEIRVQAVHAAIDSHLLAEEAYAVGHEGNQWQKVEERLFASVHGKQIPLAATYDHDALKSEIKAIAASIDTTPTDAVFSLQNGKITTTPETIGKQTDIDAIMNKIEKQLITHTQADVTLIVKDLPPKVTVKDFAQIDTELVSFTTQFNATDWNRTQNIILAAKSIDGVIIKPGEVFSFNKVVGPRLSAQGYQIAPVFINGKLVPDVGGGVCQVSSTLYNAVLLTGLPILERTSHFRPPSYIQVGLDATVADNQLDFKFKNTASTNLYLVSEVKGNSLTIRIYGNHRDLKDIKMAVNKTVIEPSTIMKQDMSLPFGKEVVESEGAKGFQTNVYRVVYQNGLEVKREFISHDEYPPDDRIIRLGQKMGMGTDESALSKTK